MNKKTTFIGIDVSKATLDIHIQNQDLEETLVLKNCKNSISVFLKKITKENFTSKIIVAMENTGLYNWQFYETISEFSVILYVLHPLSLKKSLGMTRGKNDKIDAKRIAQYISLHHHNLKPFNIPNKALRKMKIMIAQRNRFIKQRNAIKTSEKEIISTGLKDAIKQIKSLNKKTISHINNSIKKIESIINEIVHTDKQLSQTFKLITSVPGVGKVLAWELLIKTNGFSKLNNSRKLACFAGVVPFDYSSGTSVFKKPRVSVFADRKLKKLLHMAALRVIQLNGELQKYYLRKVDEGKNKMSVINAIRNKILARVCSVVKNNQKYIDNSLVLS